MKSYQAFIMESHKLTPHQAKIMAALDKVYDNLIAFKKRMNSELVVMRDGKIVKIKPWLEDGSADKS